MLSPPSPPTLFGRTGLQLPRIVFGTSCLGNLYKVVPEQTKLALVAEMVKQSPVPLVLDCAGKYGAGLALETIGNALRQLKVPASDVIISNKLGWYRVPLRSQEPQFEPGVWAGLSHDAAYRISYEGILTCYEQGCRLLGPSHAPQLVSVHDPDEFLAAACSPEQRLQRMQQVLDAYKALFELKTAGRVKAVGIGSKDWRVIREIAEQVPLDWVMFACSLTVHSHPPELLGFIGELQQRGVGMINSAVFNAGFLTGGAWYNYRKPEEATEPGLFRWRAHFLTLCQEQGVRPADACVQFGLAVPGIHAVALNTERPERIRENLHTATNPIPDAFWRALKAQGLIDPSFPYLG